MLNVRGRIQSIAVKGFGRHLGKPDASGFSYVSTPDLLVFTADYVLYALRHQPIDRFEKFSEARDCLLERQKPASVHR